MANFKNIQPIESFDWETFEKGFSQANKSNNTSVVKGCDESESQGVINCKMESIIPISYQHLQRLDCGYFVADLKEGIKLFIDSTTGNVISEMAIDSVENINKNFFATHKDNETCLFNSHSLLLLTIPFHINFHIKINNTNDNSTVKFVLNGLEYLCDLRGNLYIIGKRIKYYCSEWYYKWVSIPKRQICQAYLAYTHSDFTKSLEIIENEQHQKGLSDLEGNVMFLPQYNDIISVTDDLFIVAKPSADGKTLVYGVVDLKNVTQVPFDFKCLLPINNKYIAFTEDKTYTITEDNKYYKLNLPSFNGCYVNIKFGVIDLAGNRITPADYSTIMSAKGCDALIVGKEFGKYHTLKYGVINSAGCYILEPKYEKIGYSEQKNCFITNISYSDSGKYPYETKSNLVSIDGFYLVEGDKNETVLVPAKIADWCDNFSEDGKALVIKGGHKGHINKLYQIVAFNEKECIVIPEIFDFSGDFMYGFAPVSNNNRYGIINTKLEQILSCDYEYIEPLSAKRFKFKKNDKWGVVDSCGNIIIDSKYDSICRETEALIKVETSIPSGSSRVALYGIYNEDGNLIIRDDCLRLVSVDFETQVFVIASIKNGKYGVYDHKGSKIIPHIYERIEFKGGIFICHSNSYYSSQEREINYNIRGEQLLVLDKQQTFVVPAEYDLAYPSDNGFVIVIKDGKWGIINMQNDIIVKPQYSIIDFFDGSFARVGKSEEESYIYFKDDRRNVKNIKYGLIDTTGELVLPLEYDGIGVWDNGYYQVSNSTVHQILTPSLKVAVDLQNKWGKKLDNRYIIVSEDSNNYHEHYGLIDFHGNEIINGFSEIEVLTNGFLKVIYYRSEYGASRIGIIDNRGKQIYCNDKCDDVYLIGNGYLLVKGFENIGMDGSGRYVYNVANLQGKELFNFSLNEIKLLEDGNFSVRGDKGWGFSDRNGKFIASPKYENELEFEKGFAYVSIKGKNETLKINSSGNILVEDEEGSILLPNIYYWGSSFKYGISIVRSIECDCVGVVNVHGEEIIPVIHKSIKLLSDRTILCREDDCYGLYNTKGKCLFPTIFSEINHVAQNRIRVVWSSEIVKSWDKDKYEMGNSKCKYQSCVTRVNQRAALCDSSGTILNDKRYLYVCKFTGKYAKVYNEINEDNYKTVFSQFGVIDLDGNTLVPAEFDRIFLYEHSYAKLRKGKIYGIAHLPSKQITMFESLQITRMWNLDEYGRCMYSTDWAYDKEDKEDEEYEEYEEWKGTNGVLSYDGVIVPPKKYDRIILLGNGLIKVYKNNTVGFLDKHGKVLLPLKYSYISDFENSYASICLGGQRNENYPYNITGGKWGMIDDDGNIVSMCVNNEELVIPSNDCKPTNVKEATDYRKPTVLLSDYIPEEKISYSDDYYDSNDDDYDYGNRYSKYGGYNGYDDDAIDDAFDGDPSLTWNCD